MSGLNQETPVSMKMLNYNIDADLIMTGNFAAIRKNTDDSALQLKGGTGSNGSGAVIQLFGCNEGFSPGHMLFAVPNAAKTVYLPVLEMYGNTDTPYLDINGHRLVNVGTPTTNDDALPFQAWAAWSPSLVWTGGTPTGVTTVSRYTKIGRTIFFKLYVIATDSQGVTNLSFSAPATPANTGGFAHFAARETYGASGTTNATISFYLNENGASTTIATTQFNAATSGQQVRIMLEGFYEV